MSDLDHSIQAANAVVNIGTMPVLTSYPYELRLLLQNLISNAIKFRRPGVPPEIEVAARNHNEGLWEFCIRDNGIGIDPQYHERIFKLFKRLHDQYQYEGTGIGLAHCKKIVELFGGSIDVQSAPGEGSLFTFTLREAEPLPELMPERAS